MTYFTALRVKQQSTMTTMTTMKIKKKKAQKDMSKKKA